MICPTCSQPMVEDSIGTKGSQRRVLVCERCNTVHPMRLVPVPERERKDLE